MNAVSLYETKKHQNTLSLVRAPLFFLFTVCVVFQHANEDVERMLLGNKCDMEDKRVVPKAKGEQVSCLSLSSHQTPNNNSLPTRGRKCQVILETILIIFSFSGK